MQWNTAISEHKDGELYIRGQKLEDLMQNNSFSEGIFLLLGKRPPTETEAKLFDAILVSIIEHSVAVPTAFVPRTVASIGSPLTSAVAAGVLSVGDYHGGALEQAMHIMQDERSPERLVSDFKKQKKRVAGYGHKLYKDVDPRAETLFALTEKNGLEMTYIDRARELKTEIKRQLDKDLVLNIDGAIAALLVTFGFAPELGKAIFALGRIPGMIAHAHEEIENEKPFRRFNEDDINYVGD